MQNIYLYLAALVTILVCDALWLGLVAKNFYFSQIGHLARKSAGKLDPLWAPAIILYLIMALGFVVFVLPKVAGQKFSWMVPGYGALYGLVGFAIYDLTNFATLKNWTLKMTLVDMAWGSFVGAMVTLVMWWLYSVIR
jgi:uncharacterized membrane protein